MPKLLGYWVENGSTFVIKQRFWEPLKPSEKKSLRQKCDDHNIDLVVKPKKNVKIPKKTHGSDMKRTSDQIRQKRILHNVRKTIRQMDICEGE